MDNNVLPVIRSLDILKLIFDFLTLFDLLKLAATCKSMYHLVLDTPVYKDFYHYNLKISRHEFYIGEPFYLDAFLQITDALKDVPLYNIFAYLKDQRYHNSLIPALLNKLRPFNFLANLAYQGLENEFFFYHRKFRSSIDYTASIGPLENLLYCRMGDIRISILDHNREIIKRIKLCRHFGYSDDYILEKYRACDRRSSRILFESLDETLFNTLRDEHNPDFLLAFKDIFSQLKSVKVSKYIIYDDICAEYNPMIVKLSKTDHDLRIKVCVWLFLKYRNHPVYPTILKDLYENYDVEQIDLKLFDRKTMSLRRKNELEVIETILKSTWCIFTTSNLYRYIMDVLHGKSEFSKSEDVVKSLKLRVCNNIDSLLEKDQVEFLQVFGEELLMEIYSGVRMKISTYFDIQPAIITRFILDNLSELSKRVSNVRELISIVTKLIDHSQEYHLFEIAHKIFSYEDMISHLSLVNPAFLYLWERCDKTAIVNSLHKGLDYHAHYPYGGVTFAALRKWLSDNKIL
jgi:CII-binding regulator of phage lambda lysogenization HflD